MDAVMERMKALAGKYKYVLIVILAGLVLMLLPAKQEESPVSVDQQTVSQPDMQESLELILTKIQGVGKVKVLLTQAQGERTIYVFDESSSRSGDSESLKSDAVILTDAERAQKGMVSQVIPPVYLGAIVVCEGGDQASVRLAVVEAVCDATGLSADKISVLKMK